MTMSEFSKKIGISRITVMKMIKSGRIKALRLTDAPKSPYRIRESEIDRLIGK